MRKPDWIGKTHEIPAYIAELTGDTIHWRCAGDYDYRISEIDEQQSVEDFKRFGPPSSDVPDALARELAQRLGMVGDLEPAWLKPGDERVFALVDAAAKGDLSTVEALKSCINAFSPLHDTALIQSLARPIEVLQTLLAHGADPNLGVSRGITPLMMACEQGQQHHVRALLRAGADTAFRDDRDRTALAWACYSGKKTCAKLIVQHIGKRGAVSPTEIRAALIGQIPTLAEEMFKRSPFTPTGDLLFAAIRGNSLPLFRKALDSGVDPNVHEAGDFEVTPLIAAVQLPDRNEMVHELLKRGAVPDRQDNRGESALIWSCNAGYRSILLAAGADPNSRCHGDPGPTLLSKLCNERAPLKEVQELLEAGADPNAPQPDKKTALQSAAGNDNIDVVKLLLDRGADPTAADVNGHTADWWTNTRNIATLIKSKAGTLVKKEWINHYEDWLKLYDESTESEPEIWYRYDYVVNYDQDDGFKETRIFKVADVHNPELEKLVRTRFGDKAWQELLYAVGKCRVAG